MTGFSSFHKKFYTWQYAILNSVFNPQATERLAGP